MCEECSLLTSSAMACKWRMQEYPAQMIDFRSSITTWAGVDIDPLLVFTPYLGIKHAPCLNGVGGAAKHKPRGHVRLLNSFHLEIALSRK